MLRDYITISTAVVAALIIELSNQLICNDHFK